MAAFPRGRVNLCQELLKRNTLPEVVAKQFTAEELRDAGAQPRSLLESFDAQTIVDLKFDPATLIGLTKDGVRIGWKQIKALKD